MPAAGGRLVNELDRRYSLSRKGKAQPMISRRMFLALTGVVMVAPAASWGTDMFPPLLDHIILGCNNLERGIAFVEEHSRVRAVLGGVHPGRGTANALLSLGDRHYLEIMAPDPKATNIQPSAIDEVEYLKKLKTPRLITWAVHPPDIDALARKLRDSGIAIVGPAPGSRTRPDGRVLSWKTFSLADDDHGLLPFFIEWGANSVHPSMDAPTGCHIERFAAADKETGELSRKFQRIGINVTVEASEKPHLQVRISGAKGALELRS
jgi:Glyoxalase-like domain